MKNRKVKGCLTVFCLCLLFSACSKEENIAETQQETTQVSETENAIEDTIEEAVKNSVSMEVKVSLERVRYVFFCCRFYVFSAVDCSFYL